MGEEGERTHEVESDGLREGRDQTKVSFERREDDRTGEAESDATVFSFLPNPKKENKHVKRDTS